MAIAITTSVEHYAIHDGISPKSTRQFRHHGELLDNGDFIYDGNWSAVDNGLYCYYPDEGQEGTFVLKTGEFELE